MAGLAVANALALYWRLTEPIVSPTFKPVAVKPVKAGLLDSALPKSLVTLGTEIVKIGLVTLNSRAIEAAA